MITRLTPLVSVAAMKQHHRLFLSHFDDILTSTTQQIARDMKEAARSAAPVQTGTLQRSIGAVARKLPNLRRVRVFAKAYYGRWVEEGTKAHPIPLHPMPPGRFLRFVAKDGTVVFAKQVQHPGTKPTWFMKNAIRPHADRIPRTLNARLTEQSAKF